MRAKELERNKKKASKQLASFSDGNHRIDYSPSDGTSAQPLRGVFLLARFHSSACLSACSSGLRRVKPPQPSSPSRSAWLPSPTPNINTNTQNGSVLAQHPEPPGGRGSAEGSDAAPQNGSSRPLVWGHAENPGSSGPNPRLHLRHCRRHKEEAGTSLALAMVVVVVVGARRICQSEFI